MIAPIVTTKNCVHVSNNSLYTKTNFNIEPPSFLFLFLPSPPSSLSPLPPSLPLYLPPFPEWTLAPSQPLNPRTPSLLNTCWSSSCSRLSCFCSNFFSLPLLLFLPLDLVNSSWEDDFLKRDVFFDFFVLTAILKSP